MPSYSSPPSTKQFFLLKYSAGGHPVTQLFSQRIGAGCAWLAWKANLSPNQLTLIAAVLSLTGAWVYALPEAGVGVILSCLILTQLGYGFDCADGQLARATQRTSEYGRWLDVYLDMLTICSLAFAALYKILLQQPELLPLATLAVLFYCYARVADLFTCTLARSTPESTQQGAKSWLRYAFLILIDTPIVLGIIVLLRGHPAMLCCYLSIQGLLFVVHSLYVGRKYNRAS